MPTCGNLYYVSNTRFASAILLRPSHIKKTNKVLPPPKSGYELQLEAKAQLKALLESEKLIPRELIFITRCQRMLQANNQVCCKRTR